jgi:hypothetical protein
MKWIVLMFAVAAIGTDVPPAPNTPPAVRSVYNSVKDSTATIIEPPMILKVRNPPAGQKSFTMTLLTEREGEAQRRPAEIVHMSFQSTGERIFEGRKGATIEAKINVDGGVAGITLEYFPAEGKEDLMGSWSFQNVTEMLKGRKISMQIADLQFDLTPQQIQLMRQFAAKVRQPTARH